MFKNPFRRKNFEDFFSAKEAEGNFTPGVSVEDLSSKGSVEVYTPTSPRVINSVVSVSSGSVESAFGIMAKDYAEFEFSFLLREGGVYKFLLGARKAINLEEEPKVLLNSVVDELIILNNKGLLTGKHRLKLLCSERTVVSPFSRGESKAFSDRIRAFSLAWYRSVKDSKMYYDTLEPLLQERGYHLEEVPKSKFNYYGRDYIRLNLVPIK